MEATDEGDPLSSAIAAQHLIAFGLVVFQANRWTWQRQSCDQFTSREVGAFCLDEGGDGIFFTSNEREKC